MGCDEAGEAKFGGMGAGGQKQQVVVLIGTWNEE